MRIPELGPAPSSGLHWWMSVRRFPSGDADDQTGADRAVTLAEGEANTLVERDGAIENEAHACARARDDRVGITDLERTRDVRRAEEELRAVARRERRVTSTLLRRENVDLGLAARVRRDRA